MRREFGFQQLRSCRLNSWLTQQGKDNQGSTAGQVAPVRAKVTRQLGLKYTLRPRGRLRKLSDPNIDGGATTRK